MLHRAAIEFIGDGLACKMSTAFLCTYILTSQIWSMLPFSSGFQLCCQASVFEKNCCLTLLKSYLSSLCSDAFLYVNSFMIISFWGNYLLAFIVPFLEAFCSWWLSQWLAHRMLAFVYQTDKSLNFSHSYIIFRYCPCTMWGSNSNSASFPP